MYCMNCGAKCSDQAQFCANCGHPLMNANASEGNNSVQHIPAASQNVAKAADAPSFGYKILGFFLPVVGLVLYLVWREQTPLRAKSAGKGALWGVITLTALSVIAILLSVVLPTIIFKKNLEKTLGGKEEYGVEDVSGAETTGIIAMLHEQQENDIGYETIISIDPDIGKVHQIAKFPINQKESDKYVGLEDAIGYANFRHLFSDDYSKRVIIKESSKDKTAYVDCIDTEGNYLNIWENADEVIRKGLYGDDMPLGMQPEIQYDRTGFTGFIWDGKLTFKISNTWMYVSLNLNDLQENATVKGDPKGDVPIEMAPEQWDTRDIYALFDTVDNIAVTDWLDATKCLEDKYNAKEIAAMCGSIVRNSVIYDVDSKIVTEYIPDSYKSRNNWSGVASPDGEKIAFLSKAANDSNVKLCITSRNGGEPVEVEINSPDELKLRMEKNTTTHTEIYCTLLDWK